MNPDLKRIQYIHLTHYSFQGNTKKLISSATMGSLLGILNVTTMTNCDGEAMTTTSIWVKWNRNEMCAVREF